ncbi:Inositol polyphosphate kinase [Leishmania donovani]|uniref:Kinase n=1 Tax=Leishmania donovani TaxID=5661 RepID=A0A504XJP1_LEIDO|nr:Inositol polyphosphate kinase family protein [Leishmania donovani]CAJ1993127.1 Inositol polyphosphate kinase [Leishmania donovani]VDZ48955.1 Inositol_polyphosphate_kinase_putative/Pfam:PF03770 [Leishmania donovani]
MSGEGSPVPFDAVGGHKSSIFYGETAHGGRGTLRKKTTAWEIMYYLAMELAKEDALAQQPRTMHLRGDEARAKFVRAAGKMAAFASTLFSIRFPEKYMAKSAALKPYMENTDKWVIVEAGAPARSAVLAPLFNELFDGAEQLKGFDDRYDTGIWGLGLVDETSGMQRPCIMDVKIGFIRHSPLTPEDKVTRIVNKDQKALVRDTALRICGCRRYIHAAAGTEGARASLTCERFGKDIGYAMTHVRELSTCLKMFLSIGAPLAETNEDGQLAFHTEEMGAATSTERTRMKQRIRHVRAEIKSLLDFFESTPDGAFMLQRMAFVSASVLLLYDAAASPATARLCLIDFARSTWRKFNFDESTIGFIQGLKNLDAYLSF